MVYSPPLLFVQTQTANEIVKYGVRYTILIIFDFNIKSIAHYGEFDTI